MAPLSYALVFATTATVAAYAPPASLKRSQAFRPSTTAVQENFGFDFAEDQEENTPDIILGEERLKQWVKTVDDNSFLNRQYDLLARVRETGLLKQTADSGILSKLESNGVDLETLESLLPTLEKFGVLSLVGNNQQLLLNAAGPLLVEPAPLLLPAVAGALDVGPPAFFLAAAALLGAEGALIVNHVQVLNLDAALFAGLLLVPLSAVFAGLGVALGSAKK